MHFFAFAASTSSEPSFFELLWQEFRNAYVINEVYYEHLGIEGSDLFQIKLLLLGLFLGLSIASFSVVYDKRVLGNAVRTLLKKECLSPEKAQTLSELGYARNAIIRYSVRKSIALRRVVKCVEEEKFLAEQEKLRKEHEEKRKTDKSIGRFREVAYVFDLENDHFYIPEKQKYVADIKFERKGNTWMGAILATVIMLVMYVALLLYLPEILDILNAYFANFQAQNPKNMI